MNDVHQHKKQRNQRLAHAKWGRKQHRIECGQWQAFGNALGEKIVNCGKYWTKPQRIVVGSGNLQLPFGGGDRHMHLPSPQNTLVQGALRGIALGQAQQRSMTLLEDEFD